MKESIIGIIGGSGLYSMSELKILKEKKVKTPFGNPSDALIFGELKGRKVVFLSRHGRGHVYSPSEINYRANIYALKSVGVEQIISVSATGSMKEHIAPGHMVVVDQFVDRTRNRPTTFFENGIVAHASFAHPVCPHLMEAVYGATVKTGVKVHKGGTYVCIEGPMFSSRAESNVYRSWNVDVIGMTNYQEARLAREAEICYVTLALVTDYDCWHESEEIVDASMVIETVKKNVRNAQLILQNAMGGIATKRNCSCQNALNGAIMTDPKKIQKSVIQRLKPIVRKYL